MYGNKATDYSRFDIEFLPCGNDFANTTSSCTYNKTLVENYLNTPFFKVIHNQQDFVQNGYGSKTVESVSVM